MFGLLRGTNHDRKQPRPDEIIFVTAVTPKLLKPKLEPKLLDKLGNTVLQAAAVLFG
jgi:hypothetical protein